MINLFSFEPEFFNNNGDQGNMDALKRVIEFSGVAHKDSAIDEASFALVGDCSIAVLEHYREQLLGLVPALKYRLDNGLPTLLVGRSYELLAPKLGIELVFGARESKFFRDSQTKFEVFGYHNSELVSPKVFVNGLFVGTTLFGPLLAKNPQVLRGIVESFGISSDSEFFTLATQYAEKIRDVTSFD